MKLKYIIYLILVTIIFVTGCNNNRVSETTPAPHVSEATTIPTESATYNPVQINPKLTEKIVSSYKNFSFNLFAKICEEDKGENIFISPSSVAIALAMTYNGAKNKTKAEMGKMLGIDKIDEDKLNKGNQNLIEYLEDGSQGVELSIANSLWLRPDITFRPDFIKENKDFYCAEMSNNFDADSINKWVSEKTKGNINKVIDNISKKDDILFLINAIYFKGKWAEPFEKKNTKEEDFYLLNKTVKKHPLMFQYGNYNYYKGDTFQAVKLFYGYGKISMLVFLPNGKYDIEKFQKELNVKNWEKWMKSFGSMEGEVALPRFKIEYEANLNNALAELGMEEAFENWEADFTGMCDMPEEKNVFIRKVTHKTFIDVNEEGTEASAVTTEFFGEATSELPETFTMRVDHPFFFAIVDNTTGTILFMGSIIDPQQ
jgi:serpin B